VGRDEVTALLLDTHVLTWTVSDSKRLGRKARRFIDRATAGEGVHISAITPWEIAIGVAKRRLNLGKDALDWIQGALALPGVFLVPLTPEIAVSSSRLPGFFHADPGDQIIVATARFLSLPLLTAD
jgi:PIN domain nuclease of toxin-antitoxin system